MKIRSEILLVKKLIDLDEETKIATISKILNSTYSWASDLVYALRNEGLITVTKTGRECRVKPTKKGLDIAQHLSKLYNLLQLNNIKLDG